MSIESDLLVWKKSNQLLIIKLIAPKKGRKILIGRVIQYDSEKCNLLIYLDDDKNIYSVSIYEIEQIKLA